MSIGSADSLELSPGWEYVSVLRDLSRFLKKIQHSKDCWKKENRVKEAMGKIIEQVNSTIILILDVLIKIIVQAIAHQNSHVQPKCEKNVMPQTLSSLEK